MKKFNCYLICLFFYIELLVELTYFNTSQYMLCLPSITFDIIQITCKQRQVFNDSRVTHTVCTMCAIGKLASCYHSHIILTITVILFLCYWIWCAKFLHKAKVHQFKLSFFKIISLFALLINFTYFFHRLFLELNLSFYFVSRETDKRRILKTNFWVSAVSKPNTRA